MYTEEPRNTIDWGSLLRKGILVVVCALIVFLIIWLLTRNNTNGNNVNVNYGNNLNNVNQTLTNPETYSEIFIEDYRYFHDTAKEYFLISELPQDGLSIKYTLKQLIEKGLILPFSYTDKDSCDQEASYVTVTNYNGKYQMTVTLVCGREVAKTTEELGCNQLCNGNCNIPTVTPDDDDDLVKDPVDKLLEYRFKQAYSATETVYTCPSGYTRSGTICVKDNSTTIPAVKNVTYNCPDGYTKNGIGSSATCTKGENQTVDATKVVEYTCPNGYAKTGEGSNTKCVKTNESSVEAQYNSDYTCPSGYTKSGSGKNTKCTKTETYTIDAYEDTKYYCNEGTLIGSRCYISDSYTTNAQANTTYVCPSGSSPSGNGCYVSGSSYAATPSTTYSCSQGTNLGNGYCQVTSGGGTSYVSYPLYHGDTYNGCSYSGSYTESCYEYYGCTRTQYKYKCTNGTSSKTVAATPKTTYSCPNGGTLSGTTCVKSGTTVSGTPNTTYSCPNGGYLSGNKCVHDNQYSRAAQERTIYTCDEGVRSGSKCKITEKVTANYTETKNYYCSNGYVLNGSRCYKTTNETINPTTATKYSCNNGFTLNGDKCTSNGQVTTNSVKHTAYECPDGYTKVGAGSESKCTRGATESMAASKSTQQVTKYRYKWSTSTSLDGWERTGETREVSGTETSEK